MSLRIAHFIDTQNKGGAEVTLMDLAIYQKHAGYDVVVFQHNNEFITEQCHKHDIEVATIPAHMFYKRTYTLPIYNLALAHKLKSLKIDVLHSHLFGPITGNALAARLSNTRHIGTLHDIYTIEEKPSRAKLLSLSNLLKTDLVCVSRDMKKFYQRRLALKPEKLLVIYNASRPCTPISATTRQVLLDRYHLNDTDIIIASVGRLVPLKRFDWIIDSLSKIDIALLQNTKLLVVGDGPEKQELEKLAHNKLAGRAIFTGEISNVDEHLAISDIYVQFSNTEGLSRSIIEALAHQLPCIVSDVGGNRELVLNENNGFVLPANDSKGLTGKLEILIKNEKLRRSFAKSSLEHFNKYFDFKKYQEAYLDLYNH